jgi:nucleotide-binding universal stress UspA family protein
MRIPHEAPVVVGVNGTAAGLAAVRLGAREATARGRELRVVHVFVWPRPRAGTENLGYAAARRTAADIVEQALTTARRATPGVHVSGLLVDGLPVRVLVQMSRVAELVILGDDETATAPFLPVDCVLMQIVSRAWCPVVVARGTRPPSGPLLVAVDGSAASLLAMRHAAAEAQRLGIAVDVVHVVDRSGGNAEEGGHRVLSEALAAVPELNRARTRLLVGDPGNALVRASRQARMVIVGPRGYDGAVVLGPVAEELLRHCACPTVFVHGTTAEERQSTGTAPQTGALTG